MFHISRVYVYAMDINLILFGFQANRVVYYRAFFRPLAYWHCDIPFKYCHGMFHLISSIETLFSLLL